MFAAEAAAPGVQVQWAEVMVDGDQAFLVRARETVDEQLRLETLLP